jgi:nitrite reductase/ring-hydroxylating ferredoxin subunit
MMTQFKTPLKKNELQERKLIRADVNGRSIVLTSINGTVYAMDSVCSHEGGPLEDGTLENYDLICPWHQGIFDIRSAKAAPDTSWVTDLNSYKVTIDDKSQEIFIDTD